MVDKKTLKKLDRINSRLWNTFQFYNPRVYREVRETEVEYTVFFRKNGVKTRLDAKLPLAGIKFSHVMIHLMNDMIERVPELPRQYISPNPVYAIKEGGDLFTVQQVVYDTRKNIVSFTSRPNAQRFIDSEYSKQLNQMHL